MVQASTAHSERINLRLRETAKRRIEQAASVEGKTVSAFIVSSALETAEKTMDRHETVALARDDALRFFDALVIEPLDRRHDRTNFSCGLPELDRYLARQAGQDHPSPHRPGVRLYCRRDRCSARLLHVERAVDQPDLVARRAVAETAAPSGALRPDRSAGNRSVGAGAGHWAPASG